MTYSTSSTNHSFRYPQWWKCTCAASSMSLYFTLVVLLAPTYLPSQNWLLTDQLQTASSPLVSTLANSLLASASAEEVAPRDCTPLGAMIANRFNRSPVNSLRMLRGDGNLRDMENLIRSHHNCLLKADRIRFKKSNPANWYYKTKVFGKEQNQNLAVQSKPQDRQQLDSASVESGEQQTNELIFNKDNQFVGNSGRAKATTGRYKVAALIGWRRVGSAKQQHHHRTPPAELLQANSGGIYPIRLLGIRSNFKEDNGRPTAADNIVENELE